MPAALILRLARTGRCAIVASGTRKARAISGVVVTPPSVRSVSATCASVLVLRRLEQARLGGQRAIAPDAVDRPVASGGDQRRARVGGHAAARTRPQCSWNAVSRIVSAPRA